MKNDTIAKRTPNPVPSEPRTYRVIHGSIGLRPDRSYMFEKGDLMSLSPEEAKVHLDNGLIVEVDPQGRPLEATS